MKASLEIVQRGVIWMAELKVDGEECGQCSYFPVMLSEACPEGFALWKQAMDVVVKKMQFDIDHAPPGKNQFVVHQAEVRRRNATPLDPKRN